MSKLEQAARQALEALELHCPNFVPLVRTNTDDLRDNSITALREALAEQGCDYCNNPLFAGTACNNCGRVVEADHFAASGNKVPDHIADAGKLVEQTKATKQRTCECVVSRIIFSGDREYCETCGWPIYTFNEHRARLLEEQNV